MPMKPNELVDLVPAADLREPDEIKEACIDELEMPGRSRGQAEAIVNAVLDTIIALTPSPRTVDELTRIRGAGE